MAAPKTVMAATWFTAADEAIAVIQFNRPQVKNAMSDALYTEITALLRYYAAKESVLAVVLTGAGDYFTSGMDLTDVPSAVPSQGASHKLMHAILEHPKILVAAVNGHAIGIGVTMLVHCDVVFAAESATFMTPFMRVGIVPEFGSSYTFPAILGPALANDMLLRSKRITSATALQKGLVNEVLPVNGFLNAVLADVSDMVSQPCAPESLLTFKRVIKANTSVDKSKVLAAIKREYIDIDERFESGYIFEAAIKVQQAKSRKSKL
ncbi:enoyl-CoA hydratase/isomerase family [Achlya hypogyna]|uniref:Enoyl-CoA hydratase/isomerase family n=1 Tax=Achlya hypogyna TaxID=1202772 RepID=A0A1V9YX04_ACHHY|nr:enoyl-CoA hydratase/isomerase family [Achlya hypogyna]